LSLKGLLRELRTLYFDERPSRATPEKMLSMFERGGKFRGALHAFEEGSNEEAWLLLEDGEPVAAIGKRGDDVVCGDAAVDLAGELNDLSFKRMDEKLFRSVLSEAHGTKASVNAAR